MEDWDKVHSAADHQRSAIPTVAEIAQIIPQKWQRNSRENMLCWAVELRPRPHMEKFWLDLKVWSIPIPVHYDRVWAEKNTFKSRCGSLIEIFTHVVWLQPKVLLNKDRRKKDKKKPFTETVNVVFSAAGFIFIYLLLALCKISVLFTRTLKLRYIRKLEED